LTALAISDTPPRMGRKPLGMKLTTIRLAQATMDAIDAVVGAKRRSDFIRQAVNEKLAREEKLRAKAPKPKPE
jgi:metal-responsive CopG/Arc/MetJ family transcriptional regulator